MWFDTSIPDSGSNNKTDSSSTDNSDTPSSSSIPKSTDKRDDDLYRTADKSVPYDPFYDYSDDHSRSILGYVDGKSWLFPSNKATALRCRILIPSSSIGLNVKNFSFLNENHGVSSAAVYLYNFFINIEVFNPFPIDLTLKKFDVSDILYPLFDMVPFWEDLLNTRKFNDLRGVINYSAGLKDQIFASFNAPRADGFSSILPYPTPIVIPAQSSVILGLQLNPEYGGGLQFIPSDNKLITVPNDANYLYRISLNIRVGDSDVDLPLNLFAYYGLPPKILPSDFWRYSSSDIQSFQAKAGLNV